MWQNKAEVECSKLHERLTDVMSSLQVVNVMRNPKDVFTSTYYFHEITSALVNPGPQSEFLQKFLDGKGCSHCSMCSIYDTIVITERERKSHLSCML